MKTIINILRKLYSDLRNFSLAVAFWRLCYSLPVHTVLEKKFNTFANKIYLSSVMSYLEKKYGYIAEKYKLIKQDESQINKTIWIFWYQGENGMPDLVKACYQSMIKQNADDYNIILLTGDNYQEYVDMPDYIKYKLKNKIITITHFSDILRSILLYQYGGAWSDATILSIKKIPNEVFQYPFYSLKNIGSLDFFINNGRWVPYFMVTKKNSVFFKCLSELLLAYWIKENKLIDYMLIDFFIELMIQHIPNVKQNIEILPENNTTHYQLLGMLNSDYDDHLYKQLCINTILYKLSYKKVIEINKKNTFYKKLIQEI